MNASSHLLFAWALGVLVAIPNPVLHSLVSSATLSLGALWPDLDHPASTLGRWLPWPASFGLTRFGTGDQAFAGFYWLSAPGLSWLLRTWLPGGAVFWPFVLGGLSHLVLDNFNHEPMEWLAPWKKR